MKPRYRILLFGSGGFVGSHLISGLREKFGNLATVLATSLRGSSSSDVQSLDITDVGKVTDFITRFQPSHIVNLAGLSAPAQCLRDQRGAWLLHAFAVEKLGEVVLNVAPQCWLLNVGTGLVYGRTALDRSELIETDELRPVDTYSVTKAAGELALAALSERGLRCLRLRPFNHTGPGQTVDFAIPSFAHQLARIKKGHQPPVVKVGDLSAKRDFLDVRDVVLAYIALIEKADIGSTSKAYNVSSGKAVEMGLILDELIRISGLSVSIELDASRQRPADIPFISGSSKLLQSDTSWTPTYSIEQTLLDVYKQALNTPKF